jgi:hypothetical protein
MNIKQLKEAIKNLPDDMEIILQKDAEGNGYSPLRGADKNCIYIAETTWCGEVYSTKRSAEDNGFEEDEWKQIKKKHPRALVLFPIN